MKKLFGNFNFRKLWLMIADAFIIGVAAVVSYFFLSVANEELSDLSVFVYIILSEICSLTALFLFRAYSKAWKYFSRRDYLACCLGVTAGTVFSCIFVILFGHSVPVIYTVMQLVISLFGVCAFRYLFRSFFINLIDAGKKESKFARTMIIGGGQATVMLLNEIKEAHDDPDWEICEKAFLNPVCIIDDDKEKIGKSLCGVPIVGTLEEINRFVDGMKIQLIVFSIPSCTEDERKRILDICSRTKLPVKVLPSVNNLVREEDRTNLLEQVRDIRVEDLLGRETIKFDNHDIKELISGKVCMVTGGGGSIGSELVRQIAKYGPKQVIIVDIYENNAYDIQQELAMDYGDTLDLAALIASVRDYSRMNMIFEKYKPDIVFHSAAHKHVPLMEASPAEAVKNNVEGTYNVATLAQLHKTEKFVMISTDKAVNPTNVMGASKRCCEMIMQYLAQQEDCSTEFVTTRFGNVLGSNGSVVPLFKRQIEQGKPVTVTHPDVIRYFMTIPESVSLVLEAAAIAHGGDILVLDMGKPVRITALAENLIRMYGKIPYKDVEIKFTGLRPGEKIKEELLMDEEGLSKTRNEFIFIGKQIETDPERFTVSLRELFDAAKKNDEVSVVRILHDIIPTFVTPEEYNEKALAGETV